MKRYATVFFSLLAYLFLPQVEALNRDYIPQDYSSIFHSWCGEDEYFYDDENYHFCVEDCLDQLWNRPSEITSFLLYLFPEIGPDCTCCGRPSMYLGYIDPDFKKYTPHLKKHLEYSKKYSIRKHSPCSCLWPEYSQEAALISDTAYILFRDLISTTALSNLIEDEREQKELVENPCCFLNKHGLTISFIAQQLSKCIH